MRRLVVMDGEPGTKMSGSPYTVLTIEERDIILNVLRAELTQQKYAAKECESKGLLYSRSMHLDKEGEILRLLDKIVEDGPNFGGRPG